MTSTQRAPQELLRRVSNGHRTIAFAVVRHPRRRRVELQIEKGGRVCVRSPPRTPLYVLDDFVVANLSWIAERLSRLPPPEPIRSFASGESFAYLGSTLTLAVTQAERATSRVTISGDRLCVALGQRDRQGADLEQSVREVLRRWYRRRAQPLFEARSRFFATELNVTPQRIFVRDQKRRWGSCNSRGEIRLNWRLIQAPLSVIDYVVVHELAHLRHMNHGPRFQSLVRRACPDAKAREAQLKALGPALFW